MKISDEETKRLQHLIFTCQSKAQQFMSLFPEGQKTANDNLLGYLKELATKYSCDYTEIMGDGEIIKEAKTLKELVKQIESYNRLVEKGIGRSMGEMKVTGMDDIPEVVVDAFLKIYPPAVDRLEIDQETPEHQVLVHRMLLRAFYGGYLAAKLEGKG